MLNCVNYFRLCTAWNRCLRRCFKLPAQTHRQYLPALTNVDLLPVTLPVRCFKFCISCLSSPNVLISQMAKHSCSSYRHIMGKNILPLVCKVGINIDILKTYKYSVKLIYHDLNYKYENIDFNTIELINSLLFPADDCPLNAVERQYLLYYLCCS